MNIYKTVGTCAKEIEFHVEDNTIKDVKFQGGCPGSLTGIMSLLIGTDVDVAIERLRGITCGSKTTSCPDQLSKALESYKASLL
ncbi:TIGR03905 family TSCPD domain-containing protein [Anaeromicrobium sediminis]|uniref:ribonucleoside-diphosphate reductase n=1 Tax=Anaeromicrobium sediminis TaxID=1478221 RepID=A0A267MKR3_9FIRM|nr:TIGR03905 family TSCPD domain-containing protein [Anaeromicrobium sediminis]PAB59475.1 TIGR03905 family protein [Anaeromicrobium sediminis]